MSFMFDRETPSCFSNRVSKVRRINVNERVKLQRQIKSLEAEQSQRHYQLHKEKRSLMKELSKTQEVKGVEFVSLQRRNRLPILLAEPQEDLPSTNTKKGIQSLGEVMKPRSNSAPILPSITCRCAITGCRVRNRTIARGSSAMSLPVTREELEWNNLGSQKAASFSTDLVPLCEDHEHDAVQEVERPQLRHRHSTSCNNEWNVSRMKAGISRYRT